jgi:hypothetical protein
MEMPFDPALLRGTLRNQAKTRKARCGRVGTQQFSDTIVQLRGVVVSTFT